MRYSKCEPYDKLCVCGRENISQNYSKKEMFIMLTFEKVLEVFSDFLSHDEECKVVTSKRGYVVLDCGSAANNWSLTAEPCETPEDMLEELLSTYGLELEVRITGGRRDLTVQEAAEIKDKCEQMREKCKSC
ncbi:MAG: hypothetical protein QME45_09030 [Clostridiales bacterium]|nr:hypothetical protein [Clostridiales bacterium]